MLTVAKFPQKRALWQFVVVKWAYWTFEATLQSQNSQPEDGRKEPSKMNSDGGSGVFLEQMGEEACGGGGRVKLDPLKEVLVTSDGVAPFGLKPFDFSLRLWAEGSKRSAR